MLDKEFDFYLKNQDELVKKYNNLYIVIIGEKVVGHYTDEPTAYLESISKYKEGTFLIQHCTEGSDSYTQTFHSRVVFS